MLKFGYLHEVFTCTGLFLVIEKVTTNFFVYNWYNLMAWLRENCLHTTCFVFYRYPLEKKHLNTVKQFFFAKTQQQ